MEGAEGEPQPVVNISSSNELASGQPSTLGDGESKIVVGIQFQLEISLLQNVI